MNLHLTRRRHLAPPPRIEALNRKRRIMRDPHATHRDFTRIELLMLLVCVYGFAGFVLLSNL